MKPDKKEITKYFLKNLFLVIVMNTVIAFLLLLSRHIAKSVPAVIITSQTIGICTYLIVISLFWKLRPERRSWRIVLVVIGIVGGFLIGWSIASLLLHRFLQVPFDQFKKEFWQVAVLGIIFGMVCSYFFISRAILRTGKKMIQEEKIKRLASEKETLEANLRMLQAQIEPHFLFNTLSTILSLIDTDPGKGKSMLLDLIRYLRTALSRTRHHLITIDQEMEMVQSYLNIIRTRMGDRLKYKIEVPETLRSYPFPPMLLQPLVENAVRHGLEPKIGGGEISINVAETGDLLRIEVIDTGLGLGLNHESGVGIANVKERVRLLFGEKGNLRLEENIPTGLKVIIEVPKDAGQGDHRG